jgi:hypothetical protein
MVTADVLRVVHAGREVAVHAREPTRAGVDTAHFENLALATSPQLGSHAACE